MDSDPAIIALRVGGILFVALTSYFTGYNQGVLRGMRLVGPRKREPNEAPPVTLEAKEHGEEEVRPGGPSTA